MRERLLISLLFVTLLAGCESGGGGGGDLAPDAATLPALPPVPPFALVFAVDTAAPVAQVDPRFLSVALDTSQVVGGNWWSESGEVELGTGNTRTAPFDFSRERLRNLARELAPAYLRIGGSEADRVHYDLGDEPLAAPPAPFALSFTKAQWDTVAAFATAMGFELMFTVNAGPGTRDEQLAWQPAAARDWIAYTSAQGYPVAVWELGNEINAYPLFHGLDFAVSGAQAAADMATFKALVAEAAPGARVAGPSSAFWPVAGEIRAIYPDFVAAGFGDADIITWHYYPQQSRRCPLASQPAHAEVMLDVERRREVETWAAAVEAPLPPGTEIWLGETGNAQCGGEPGVSDAFAGSFWWLDQLGRIARRGQQVVVRQTLSGSNYGLIEDGTLHPNPDYWASVLWKRLMGARVLAVQPDPAAPGELAVFAHCAEGLPGGLTLLALNTSQSESQTVSFPALPAGPLQLWLVTAESLTARDVDLNGEPLAAEADGTPPPLAPLRYETSSQPAWLTLPPLSYAFVQLPGADAPACR